MKKLINILSGILFVIILVSCEKDCISSINGEWILVQTESGGIITTPEDYGENVNLKIDDFIYKMFVNDSLVFETQYDLILKPDSVLGPKQFIVFESGYEQGISITETEMEITDYNWIHFIHYMYRRN